MMVALMGLDVGTFGVSGEGVTGEEVGIGGGIGLVVGATSTEVGFAVVVAWTGLDVGDGVGTGS